MCKVWPSLQFFKERDEGSRKESQEMTSETLEIIKQKEDWKFSVEIKENAKGEPAITVKSRSDGTAKEAGDEALAEYNRLKAELIKGDNDVK